MRPFNDSEAISARREAKNNNYHNDLVQVATNEILTLSGSSVDNGLSSVAHGEHGRSLDGVLLLLGEGVLAV